MRHWNAVAQQRVRTVMKPLIIGFALMLAACSAPSPTVTPAMLVSRSPVPSPAISCGDLAAELCQPAASAALKLLSSDRGIPIRVELGRGVFCPTPGLLFKNTTCPGGAIPPTSGGQWIGHALISLVGTPNQTYINVWRNGSTFDGLLIAVATAPPTPSPS